MDFCLGSAAKANWVVDEYQLPHKKKVMGGESRRLQGLPQSRLVSILINGIKLANRGGTCCLKRKENAKP